MQKMIRNTRKSNPFRRFSLTLVWTWFGIFALVPLACVFITSFLQHDDQHLVLWHATFHNYTQLMQPIFLKILLQSLALAASIAFFCLLIGYPAAYIIARLPASSTSLLLLLMIIPFWTSSLVRTYAILAILKARGILNTFLLALGLIHHPLSILYNNTAVLIGATYDLLPFMILPLYANIKQLDDTLIEAARDLGASRFKIFKDVILPLTMPGVLAGTILVFLPAMTLFYIPVLLGGAKSILLGNLIESQFLSLQDWPGGCASCVLLTALMIILLNFYRRYKTNAQELL